MSNAYIMAEAAAGRMASSYDVANSYGIPIGKVATPGRFAKLDEAGLQPEDVKGDGACFFRAVAFQLWGDQERHGEVRASACTEMLANKSEYEPFVSACAAEQASSRPRRGGAPAASGACPVEDYVLVMKRPATYAEGAILAATAAALGVAIRVLEKDLGAGIVYGKRSAAEAEVVVFLLGNHYWATRPKSGRFQPLRPAASSPRLAKRGRESAGDDSPAKKTCSRKAGSRSEKRRSPAVVRNGGKEEEEKRCNHSQCRALVRGMGGRVHPGCIVA